MDSKKIKIIKKLNFLQLIYDVQYSFKLAKFYLIFINKFSKK